MLRESLHEILKREAEPGCLHHEMFHFMLEKVRPLGRGKRRRSGDNRSEARVHFEQTIGNKLTHYFVSRVGIDLKALAQGTNRRKAFPRSDISGYDCLLGCIDYLFINGNTRLE
jgi:hypothetical protein